MIHRLRALRLIVAVATTIVVAPTTSGPQSVIETASGPGQTRTLLPDGRWLLVGGVGPAGPRATASVWDPAHPHVLPVADHLREARAWHSATMLSDGTVLIAGGGGASGIVTSLELFDPHSQTFTLLPGTWPTARLGHSATLLIDGQVVIAGGVDDTGIAVPTAELWDPGTQTWRRAPSLMSTPRQHHSATLLPDGGVLLWGGTDATGTARSDGEIFDRLSQQFLPVGAAPPVSAGPSTLVESLPSDGAVNVQGDTVSLRFSAPLDVAIVTSATVSLSSPRGPEAIAVVPAESGRLVFVRPEHPLVPGTRYTVSVSSLTDTEGRSVAPERVSFTTRERANTPVLARPPALAGTTSAATRSEEGPEGNRTTAADDEEWVPDRRTGWRTGRSESEWRSLPSRQAPTGITALAGQVLRLNGEPLADVSLRIGSRVTQTDDTGRFLLTGIEPGVHALVIDGRTANRPGWTHGRFDVNVELKRGETAVLPSTIWMPKLDTRHATTIPRYTTDEVVVTTPRIPGLELRLPAHAALRDEDGKPVTEITITPVPLDRPPFPLPAGVDVPLYFTIQPGGAYVYTRSGLGAALVYPNRIGAPEATKFQFWNYDAERKGWYVYGLGAVTADGRQVAPDPGVRIYELTAAMVQGSGNVPPEGTSPGSEGTDGDPVDLATGLFVLSKTDLTLPDVLPIVLTRTYRPRDTISRAFGIGATHPYDVFLVGNSLPYTWQELILSDGGRLHFNRISSGAGFTDAVYEHTATPTRFYKARIAWNGNGWTMTLKDGTLLMFPDSYNTTRPQAAALTEWRDRVR
jgi:hypothetical protein